MPGGWEKVPAVLKLSWPLDPQNLAGDVFLWHAWVLNPVACAVLIGRESEVDKTVATMHVEERLISHSAPALSPIARTCLG